MPSHKKGRQEYNPAVPTIPQINARVHGKKHARDRCAANGEVGRQYPVEKNVQLT
jgi:hypothetical protein